jgi:hypothetical protein
MCNAGYGARRQRPITRRDLPEEECSTTGNGYAGMQVVSECVAHLVGKRQGSLGWCLCAADPNAALMPIEVVKRQVRDLTGANAKSSEQQQDRSVSETEHGIARALSQDLLKLLRA